MRGALADAGIDKTMVDALGVKPLYYTQSPRGVAFCSEIKGLLALAPEAQAVESEIGEPRVPNLSAR